MLFIVELGHQISNGVSALYPPACNSVDIYKVEMPEKAMTKH